MRTDYQAIFKKAYHLMDEAIIEGDCGEQCGYHCCRRIDVDGKRLGMYLLPLEYEYMQSEVVTDCDLHRHRDYNMPPKIKKYYYMLTIQKQVSFITALVFPMPVVLMEAQILLIGWQHGIIQL